MKLEHAVVVASAVCYGASAAPIPGDDNYGEPPLLSEMLFGVPPEGRNALQVKLDEVPMLPEVKNVAGEFPYHADSVAWLETPGSVARQQSSDALPAEERRILDAFPPPPMQLDDGATATAPVTPVDYRRGWEIFQHEIDRIAEESAAKGQPGRNGVLGNFFGGPARKLNRPNHKNLEKWKPSRNPDENEWSSAASSGVARPAGLERGRGLKGDDFTNTDDGSVSGSDDEDGDGFNQAEDYNGDGNADVPMPGQLGYGNPYYDGSVAGPVDVSQRGYAPGNTNQDGMVTPFGGNLHPHGMDGSYSQGGFVPVYYGPGYPSQDGGAVVDPTYNGGFYDNQVQQTPQYDEPPPPYSSIQPGAGYLAQFSHNDHSGSQTGGMPSMVAPIQSAPQSQIQAAPANGGSRRELTKQDSVIDPECAFDDGEASYLHPKQTVPVSQVSNKHQAVTGTAPAAVSRPPAFPPRVITRGPSWFDDLTTDDQNADHADADADPDADASLLDELDAM